jgi:hypothetical protein
MQKAQAVSVKKKGVRAVTSAAFRRGRELTTPRKQEEFEQASIELAARLGWEGNPRDELFRIRVVDAQNYLRKTMHEIHVHHVDPAACSLPTVDSVADYLGIVGENDETERLQILTEVLNDLTADEAKSAASRAED